MVSITDETGEPITGIERFTESMIDHTQNTGSASPKTTFTQLAQPVAGTYSITLRSNDAETHDAFIYAYNQLGKAEILQQTLSPEAQTAQLNLDFDPQNTSHFETTSPFVHIQETLRSLDEQQSFSAPMLYPLMDYLARVGERAEARYHQRILSAIQDQIEQYPSLFSQLARDVLLNQLGLIKQQFPPAE
jgi:hypothetical protein